VPTLNPNPQEKIMHIPHAATASLGQRWRLTAAALTVAALASMVWLASPSLAATYGPYNIRAAHSGKCLDVRSGIGATSDGVAVQQWTCLGPAQTNQQWYLADTGDGSTYYVTARHSGKCLDVRSGIGAISDGVPLQQWTYLGYAQSNQRWSLTRAPNGATFDLRAANSGKCMDVRGGIGAISDGVAVRQWTCLGPAQTNQQWYLTSP
jgi:fermentation-respiration switch protein FrsA (DUF1100 family)